MKTPRNRPKCPCARCEGEGQSCEIRRPESVMLVPPGWHSAGPVCEHEDAPVSSRYKAQISQEGFGPVLWRRVGGRSGRPAASAGFENSFSLIH